MFEFVEKGVEGVSLYLIETLPDIKKKFPPLGIIKSYKNIIPKWGHACTML